MKVWCLLNQEYPFGYTHEFILAELFFLSSIYRSKTLFKLVAQEGSMAMASSNFF